MESSPERMQIFDHGGGHPPSLSGQAPLAFLRRESATENLPSKQRLRHKAQHNVSALTSKVISPLPHWLVLQELHDRKAVKENEERDDDPDDKTWRRNLAG